MNTNTVVVGVISLCALGTTGAVIYKMMIVPKQEIIRTETTGNTNDINSPASEPKAVKNKTNSCIITISGQQYDVTTLIGKHPGGDVFSGKCGTDMTAVFNSQHGSNLRMIEKYKVSNSNNIVNSASPETNGKQNKIEKQEREDEREFED